MGFVTAMGLLIEWLRLAMLRWLAEAAKRTSGCMLLQGFLALGAAQFQSGPSTVAVGVVNGTLLGEDIVGECSAQALQGWCTACCCTAACKRLLLRMLFV